MAVNSKSMTLEEKLVQHIKEIGLGALIGDEDSITELTRRAITEALYQPLRVKEDYRTVERDSPVVAAARDIAKQAIAALVEEQVKKLAADPEAMRAIRESVVMFLPQAVREATQGLVQSLSFTSGNDVLNRLRQAGLLGKPV
jgi:hypothetical protein